MSIRVAVVDDHALVRAGLIAVVDRAVGLEVAATCASGEELLDALATGTVVDVAVVDLLMPGRGGFETLVDVVHLARPPAVLMVSARQRTELVVRCIKAGARGFLTKDCDATVFVEAVHRVAAGEIVVDPAVAGAVLAAVAEDPDLSSPRHRLLSDREMEVFLRLAAGETAAQAASALALSPKTVSTYRRRVLTKLALDNNAQLTAYAIEQGLIDEVLPALTPPRLTTTAAAGLAMTESFLSALAARYPELPVGIVAVDRDGRITLWNRRAQALFRRPARAVLGQPVASVSDGAVSGPSASGLRRALEAGREWFGVLEVALPDGRSVDVSLMAMPLVDAGGAVCGAAALAFTEARLRDPGA